MILIFCICCMPFAKKTQKVDTMEWGRSFSLTEDTILTSWTAHKNEAQYILVTSIDKDVKILERRTIFMVVAVLPRWRSAAGTSW